MNNKYIDPLENISKHSQYVAINLEMLDRITQKLRPDRIGIKPQDWPVKLTTCNKIEETINYWFVADSMAFCFWGYPKKWTINYQGQELDGWWALLASHQRALEQGIPLLSAAYLAKLTLNELKSIYRGEPEIPLIKERLEILRGIGQVLEKKYHNSFSEYLKSSPKMAWDLVCDIGDKFSGFRDVATYQGQTIFFYKKAQLLVADIKNIKRIEKVIKITGEDQLIGEADYKIPALLRTAGILEYAPELANLVDKRQELDENSPMEIEIRANMLWVIQLMLRKLKPKYPELTASKLDRYLWFMSQDKTLIDKPYHLIRTVNY